jgi:hypothetical protein
MHGEQIMKYDMYDILTFPVYLVLDEYAHMKNKAHPFGPAKRLL